MDIQQKEKESLATYVHRLRTEAEGCNFTTSQMMLEGYFL